MCAARLERERELSAGLRALAGEASRTSASMTLEGALLEAFRQRQPPVRRTSARTWIPLAAAAALLVGAGLWLSRSNIENPAVAQPEPLATTNSVAPAPETATSKTTTVPWVSKTNVGVTATRPRRSPRPSRFVAAEGFMMLPMAANLPAFESGEIVRMELPVTALPAYGLEIAPDARRLAVEADLLVGQDGQARAIRLVNNVRLQPNQ
jgi:hypothetical protein